MGSSLSSLRPTCFSSPAEPDWLTKRSGTLLSDSDNSSTLAASYTAATTPPRRSSANLLRDPLDEAYQSLDKCMDRLAAGIEADMAGLNGLAARYGLTLPGEEKEQFGYAQLATSPRQNPQHRWTMSGCDRRPSRMGMKRASWSDLASRLRSQEKGDGHDRGPGVASTTSPATSAAGSPPPMSPPPMGPPPMWGSGPMRNAAPLPHPIPVPGAPRWSPEPEHRWDMSEKYLDVPRGRVEYHHYE